VKQALVIDLGRIEYGAAWELQRRLVAARKAALVPDLLLLCEHPHTITLGRNGKLDHLRASPELLRQMDVAFFETDRGGDITYHGPGQLVGYPILDLAGMRRDVSWYVSGLEEAMIRTAAEWGIAARRVPERRGVWVETAAGLPAGTGGGAREGRKDEPNDEQKLGAIGVHVSRWVTSHGFALNVSTALRYFDLIVPCGIAGKRATSLEKLLGRPVQLREVAPRVTAHFGAVFALPWRQAGVAELEAMLAPGASRTGPGAAGDETRAVNVAGD